MVLGMAVLWGVRAVAAPAALATENLPLYFEANEGQFSGPAQFFAHGNQSQFFVSPGVAEMRFFKLTAGHSMAGPSLAAHTFALDSYSGRALQLRFIGADPLAQIYGDSEMPGKINYLIGNDSSKWQTGIPTYAKVHVTGIYPGVDLVYYGNQRQIEYDFSVGPNANPDAITIRFTGADKISLNENGDLILNLGDKEIRQPKPIIYQRAGSGRVDIAGGYKMLDAHTVAFSIADYDHTLPLVIDPILSFSTFYAGSVYDAADSVAVDTNGSIYIAGETLSPNLATAGAFQTAFGGGTSSGDAFVAKFNSTGSNLIYYTYLGGNEDDLARKIAVDHAGHVFVTGYTDSPNFPTTNALYPKILGYAYVNPRGGATYYNGNAFVSELDPTGSHLIYSTYLGGSGIAGSAGVSPGVDEAFGIAVDANDNTYVAGFTCSTNFPTTNSLVAHLSGTNNVFNHLGGSYGIYNAFVSEIGAGGSPLKYSTYFGGDVTEAAYDIAVDSAGGIYITGFASSTNFPVTTNAFQTLLNDTTNNYAPDYDAFVTKFTQGPTNLSLAYSTFLGGTNDDYANAIAVDGLGDAYVIGATTSPDFPDTITNISGLYDQATNNVPGAIEVTNVFVTEMGPTGTNILNSVVFGGYGEDIGYGVALDPVGNIYVCGAASFSTNFPVFNVSGLLSTTNSGGYDAFITAFSKNFSGVMYSGLLGAGSDDYAYGIAVDPLGNAYITGETFSPHFPTTNAIQPTVQSTSESAAFLAKIISNTTPPTPTVTIQNGQVQVTWPSGLPYEPESSYLFALQSITNLTSTNWMDVPGSPILSNNEYSVVFNPTNNSGFYRLELVP